MTLEVFPLSNRGLLLARILLRTCYVDYLFRLKSSEVIQKVDLGLGSTASCERLDMNGVRASLLLLVRGGNKVGLGSLERVGVSSVSPHSS